MKPKEVVVTGRFATNAGPVRGMVRFVPSRLWVVLDGKAWACLAPTIVLANDGSFVAHLTPTDADPIPWYYDIYTPAGEFRVEVSHDQLGYSLKELIDDNRAKPRPTD